MYLSIVVPIFEEEENIAPLHAEILQVVTNLEKPAEIIYIDDGSRDASFAVLRDIARNTDSTRVIRFRRNFGQTAALAAGLQYARGDIIVTMDGDQQNDPADIPNFLTKIEEGYDLVCGWRYDRQDKYWSRKFPSMLANKLISRTTEVELHDYGCTLKAMTIDVAMHIDTA